MPYSRILTGAFALPWRIFSLGILAIWFQRIKELEFKMHQNGRTHYEATKANWNHGIEILRTG
jgi:hypothetical protein